MIKDRLKEIGATLKEQRQQMSLSLKEVENSTSIRMSYLHAIEEGDTTKLISPVYAQGFIKQYATFLGLDGDRFVQENPDIFNKSEQQHFDYGIGTLEVRGHPGSSVKWVPNALWVGAIILITLTGWYLAKLLEVI